MADVMLALSSVYLIAAIFSLAYRGYGVFARVMTRRAASKALEKIGVNPIAMNNLSEQVSLSAKQIFSDSIVNENEFVEFAELALASYISDKNRIIAKLHSALEAQDLELRILGFLLQRTLKDKSFLEAMVLRLTVDSHTDFLRDGLTRILARHRFESYAVEFSNQLSGDFSAVPEGGAALVEREFFRRVSALQS